MKQVQKNEMEEIMAQHEGPLMRYALRLTKDMEKARDVVQDTFLRLCKADYPEIKPYLTQWLFKVCRNRALDMHRKEKRMVPLHENSQEPSETPENSPLSQIQKRESQNQISTFLEALPENQQEVIRLKFQNGLGYREISHITGLTISHVGVLIHTAIMTLREKIHSQPSISPKNLREVRVQ